MTTELGMKPEDLISTMISESGMNPAAHNPGGASGLIQFMPNTLIDVGFTGTPAQFRQLSGEQQLPWIKKLIQGHMQYQGGKPFTSGGQYYVANLWPVALKLPGVIRGNPNTVILEKNPVSENGYSKKYLDIGSKIRVEDERAAYNTNPLFDKERKGFITLGDLNNQVNINKNTKAYKNTMSAIQSTTGYKPNPNSNFNPTYIQHKNMQAKNEPSIIDDLEGLLDKYVSELFA